MGYKRFGRYLFTHILIHSFTILPNVDENHRFLVMKENII